MTHCSRAAHRSRMTTVDGLTITLPEGTRRGTWTSLYGPDVAQPVGLTYEPLARLEPRQTVVVARGRRTGGTPFWRR